MLPKRRSREHQTRHHPAVPYSEVPKVVVAVRRMTSRVPLRLLFEFLVLTAVRSGEAREAQWNEIDLDGSTWVIAREADENRVPASRAPVQSRP